MELGFIWAILLAAIGFVSGHYNPNCDGKSAIVHLFEWKWKDIATECEQFLGPNGYCGFQVSPPAEHIFLSPADSETPYPWWQRYQPVSYNLSSRSGTEDEFIDMVQRCNAVGVRTYVDAVIGHMVGRERQGMSPYYNSTYNGGTQSFPSVPYTAAHFTPRSLCPSSTGNVEDYQNAEEVRNCYLAGLTDLYGGLSYVQNKVATYLNHLVSIGVAGIRIDAAKHMWPQDILDILSKVNNLPTEHGFPENSELFVYQDVIDFNNEAIKASEYFDSGRVMEYRFSRRIAQGITDYSLLTYLVDDSWNTSPSNLSFVFVDTHDSQRDSPDSVITFKRPREYKQAVAYMLAYDYGFPMVMSSYNFTNRDQGPPGTGGMTADVFDSNGDCTGDWICEHRWKTVSAMIRFRNNAGDSNVTNYWNNGVAVGFTRQNKCFFAMAQSGHLNHLFSTDLGPGTYCNIIDDCATKVVVETDGTANVTIDNEEEPIVAFCTEDIDPTTTTTDSSLSTSVTGSGTTTQPPLPNFQRTAIMIVTRLPQDGEYFFIRGGTDRNQAGCTNLNDSTCDIDIQMLYLGGSSAFESYNAWLIGDTHLDWFGAQENQGKYKNQTAEGTPMGWTSNDPSSPNYYPINRFGDAWMAYMNMDCSETRNGWFEVRAFNGSSSEIPIQQDGVCVGLDVASPFSSENHMGLCGHLNIFFFNQDFCSIEPFLATD